jgi:hypothetical protein
MPTNFLLTLDTTAPGGVAVSIDAGAAFTTDRDVSVAISSTDPDLTGYTVKIYGDVDAAFDANVQPLEANSAWITLASPHAVRISTGDGTKTIKVKVRDDVHNVSSEATDTITLDTSAPVPNVTSGPTPSKVSKQASKDTASFVWSSDADFVAYKVKVVPSSGSLHSAGTQIPTTAGSSNMSGSGAVSAGSPITSSINGADLETAGAEGANVVKVFVQDSAGNWSV